MIQLNTMHAIWIFGMEKIFMYMTDTIAKKCLLTIVRISVCLNNTNFLHVKYFFLFVKCKKCYVWHHHQPFLQTQYMQAHVVYGEYEK